VGNRGAALGASSRPIFILNGRSVHVKQAEAHIARIAAEFGAETQVVVTRPGEDISALAARALRENREPVVAGRGDGTVNAVAGVLAGRDVALGVLPMGAFNHFRRDAGAPRSLEAAVRNVFAGEARTVDVGEVNGRVFVNNSGVGVYPHFVREREALERRGSPKRIAFALAVEAIVRRYLRLRIEASTDGAEALERITPFLFVGNNRCRTPGLEIGTRPRPDSGRLWICTGPAAAAAMSCARRCGLWRARPGSPQRRSRGDIGDPGQPRVDVSTDGEVSSKYPPAKRGL